jgi:RNA 2',3'-cyclic 3'-phosphodiesterase
VSDERARLFVALELPEEIRGALIEWRDGVLAALQGLRPVARESLHVTLCFLGWRAVSELDAASASCGSVAGAPAGVLALRSGIWLAPRRPHVLAVEIDDEGGRLAAVQSVLSQRLVAAGLYEPERRPFLAHVTVARVARGMRVRPRELPPVPELRFTGTRVTLFRSRLQRGGARYEALTTVTLGDEPRP